MDVKNCLFSAVYKTGMSSVKAARRIIDQMKIENAYAIVTEKIQPSEFKQCFDYYELKKGNYDIYMQTEPLDRNFINPISEYTEEIMHMMDRFGRSFTEKKVDLLYRHIHFWECFLEQREISFVVFSGIPHEVFDYIIYRLCEKMGIRFSMTNVCTFSYYAGINGRFFVNNLENQMSCEVREKIYQLEQEYANIEDIPVSKNVENWITEIESLPNRAKTNSLKKIFSFKIEKIKAKGGNLRKPFYIWKDNSCKVKYFPKMCRYALREIQGYWKEWIHTFSLVNHYEKIACEPDLKGSCYIYYALHYQPESSSCPLGGIFANQIVAIRMLSYNLPNGWYVYVKEHPAQIAFGRIKEFYDEISQIPNVKLISSRVSNISLIMNSLATASLTGETIWESMVLGKPSLVLGYTNAVLCSGAHQINTNEQCRECYKKIANGTIEITTRKELKIICNAIESICFEIDQEIENEKYVDSVIKIMKRK